MAPLPTLTISGHNKIFLQGQSFLDTDRIPYLANLIVHSAAISSCLALSVRY